MKKSIPVGIIIISIIYFISAIAGAIFATIAFIQPDLLLNLPGFNIPLDSSMFLTIKISLIFFAILSSILGLFLLKQKNWARYGIIIISLIMVIGGILSIIEKNYLSSINLIFNLLIVLYLLLSKKVRLSFKNSKKNIKIDDED
ncbi:DUF2127 domain-containing protein [Candidatus Pacearchaeota archaeon]|nr:DUF2127 domain-containing protein [Candidatus Pacearchaeota archaeon]